MMAADPLSILRDRSSQRGASQGPAADIQGGHQGGHQAVPSSDNIWAIGPLPEVCADLRLDPAFERMVRDAFALADHPNPPWDAAVGLANRLADHWLGESYESLRLDYSLVTRLALNKFGFQVNELPQLDRLEQVYRYHSGIICLIYDICERTSVLYHRRVEAPTVQETRKRGRGGAGKRGPAAKRARTASAHSEDEEPEEALRESERFEDNFALHDAAENQIPERLQMRTKITERLYKTIELCYHLYENCHCGFRAFLAASPDEPVHTPVNDYDLMRFSHLHLRGLKPHQLLLNSLSRHFVHQRYRRFGDQICQEMLITTPEGIYHTHYWKALRTIKEEITGFCNQRINAEAWKNSTAGMNNFEFVVKNFTEGRNAELQAVKPFRRLFAYKNGILLLGTSLPGYSPAVPLRADGHGRFFEYGSHGKFSSEALPQESQCAQYFDLEVPVDIIAWINGEEDVNIPLHGFSEFGGRKFDTHWPTPLFDSMFERQGFHFFEQPFSHDDGTQPSLGPSFYIYAMLGRLLYAVKEEDNWQVAIFFLGLAGTGKSNILEIIRSFYQEEAVGTLSSNCQQTFALSSFVNSLLVMIPEVKADIQLASSEFQSMVTGESITINVKQKETVKVRYWQSQMLMAGNEIPAWADALGALLRRLFCVPMDVPVSESEVDTTLLDRIKEQEIFYVLFKLHACYRVMLDSYRNVSFWSAVHPVFQRARDTVEMELNPTKKFVLTASTLERDTYQALEKKEFTRYISYERLMQLCGEWCNAQSIRKRGAGGSREHHNKKVLEDSGYQLETLVLPTAENCPSRVGIFVLGLEEVTNSLRLPADWKTTCTPDPGVGRR